MKPTLPPGSPVKAGEAVRVPVGTLENAGELQAGPPIRVVEGFDEESMQRMLNAKPGSIIRVPDPPTTPEALFEKLREMGVSCETCRWDDLPDLPTWACETQIPMTEPGFCHEWEPCPK